jgi:hypothetical protein
MNLRSKHTMVFCYQEPRSLQQKNTEKGYTVDTFVRSWQISPKKKSQAFSEGSAFHCHVHKSDYPQPAESSPQPPHKMILTLPPCKSQSVPVHWHGSKVSSPCRGRQTDRHNRRNKNVSCSTKQTVIRTSIISDDHSTDLLCECLRQMPYVTRTKHIAISSAFSSLKRVVTVRT